MLSKSPDWFLLNGLHVGGLGTVPRDGVNMKKEIVWSHRVILGSNV